MGIRRRPGREPTRRARPDNPLGQVMSPGLRQEIRCRPHGPDGALWWHWVWTGPTRKSEPELEPLCPVGHRARRRPHPTRPRPHRNERPVIDESAVTLRLWVRRARRFVRWIGTRDRHDRLAMWHLDRLAEASRRQRMADTTTLPRRPGNTRVGPTKHAPATEELTATHFGKWVYLTRSSPSPSPAPTSPTRSPRSSTSSGNASTRRPRRPARSMNTSPEERRAARGLAQQFPGVHAWYSQTRQWWAMVPLPGGDRLLSAPNVRQLRDEISNARAHAWQPR